MLQGAKILQIELTSLCNAQCPMCTRNIKGEGINPYMTLSSLPLQWFKQNISGDQIKQLDKIFFCGTVGEPASSPDLLDIIQYFKNHNPDIVVGLNTNGGLKTAAWWSKLGHLLDGTNDYCVFSIDGLEDTNHLYRRNVEWRKIIENVKAFISTGASAHWDMLVFDHNKHQINDAKSLATKLGFTWFRSKETDRWDMYKTNIGLKPASPYKEIDYNASLPVCEIDRDKSVFLDYLGEYWPCCHIAEAYLNVISRSLHKDIREYNNIQLFNEYQQRLQNGVPFYICKRACGKTTSKRNQWKTEEQLK